MPDHLKVRLWPF